MGSWLKNTNIKSSATAGLSLGAQTVINKDIQILFSRIKSMELKLVT